MLKQSNQFTNAIKSDVRDARARVTINDIVYDDDVINNIEFSGSALSGEQFSIGSTHENTIKVEFSGIIDTLTALDKVYVEIGFKRAEFDESLKKKTNIKMGKSRMGTRLNLWNSREDVEYSLMGEFYITEHVDINYNDKITTISCKDQTVFLEDDYESNLTYPTDIRNVIIEIANQTGVQVDTLNIEELEGIQVGKIEGYSHRQALGFLAQLLVGYVYFNRKGLLQIKQLSESDYDISTEEYFSKGLTKNGIRYRVGGIACNVPSDDEPQDLFVGSKLGPQITIENPLMTQSLLQSIYDKLQDIDYYPFDLDWRGNPALEVGDLVTVYDVEGHELKVPNLNYGLTYNGGLVASSSADTKSRTDIVASGRKTLQQQIHTTQQRIKEESDNLMDAFQDAQEKITGNQGGFIIQRMNEDGKPYEFLVMDPEDINTASNVIRLNQQGIGFSRNGYNGPFGVAITIDGQIVADYITAGTLRADLIQSGFNEISPTVEMTGAGLIVSSSTGGRSMELRDAGLIMSSDNLETGSLYGIDSPSRGKGIALTTYDDRFMGFYIEDGIGLKSVMYIDGHTRALNMDDNQILNVGRIGFGNPLRSQIYKSESDNFYVRTDNELTLRGDRGVEISGQNFEMYEDTGGGFVIDSDGSLDLVANEVTLYSDLNMNSYTIINESDVRLKKNIEVSSVNALKEIDRMEFIEWDWDKVKRPHAPDGRQFGVKAQYAPFLQTKAADSESYLSIDLNKYVNLIGKGLQELHDQNKQLIKRVEELEDVINAER